MVQRPPESLRAVFPWNADIAAEAREIRTLWRDWWTPFIMEHNVTPSEKAYKIVTEGGVITLTDMDETGKKNLVIDVQGIYPKFNAWDPQLRLDIAAEIAFQTYRSRHGEAAKSETGLWRGFADGALWSSVIGMWYIQALELAGLTGLYLPVRFDRYSSNLRKGTVQVIVVGGMVKKLADNTIIGYLIYDKPVPETYDEDAEDGSHKKGDTIVYTMEDGIVTIKEPSTELTESVTELDETFTNPVEGSGEPEA